MQYLQYNQQCTTILGTPFYFRPYQYDIFVLVSQKKTGIYQSSIGGGEEEEGGVGGGEEEEGGVGSCLRK